ncbi:hypothetical protein [Sphingobium sp. CCH11-B1]|jgi:ABC-type oligopeptide transport system substrate-binding subunit|uniref:hypothetical protein n=1 Tax=Sphingobium sp. CCH11-B1 TaxID=1768781 RepID=UPI0008361198|nr:hypothetical protein [Sphingobium sp. CCH11-B1]MEA3387726.1 hypothetical protein [Pseudomonadota bacterium]
MRRTATTALTAALLLGCLPLAACGKQDETSTKVQMKDMEVVDGTATDAMTDLDGVQGEGASAAMPGGNATSNTSAPAAPAQEKATTEPTEVVSDQ